MSTPSGNGHDNEPTSYTVSGTDVNCSLNQIVQSRNHDSIDIVASRSMPLDSSQVSLNGSSSNVTSDVPIDLYNAISQGATRGKLATLDDFCTRMSEASIPGPYFTTDVHLGSKLLGKGAQFQVFGSDNALVDPDIYARTDRPYRAVESDVRGQRQRLVVAIKRPIFNIPTGVMPVNFGPYNENATGGTEFTHKPLMGFGTVSQQRNLQLEVFALSHAPLRSHENIVKLIAWGFDTLCDEEESTNPTAPKRPIFPFLIMEHANCSLAAFVRSNFFSGERENKRDSKLTPIPLPILQHLVLGVAQGLQALHTCGIVHADIKPDNVLVFPRENSSPYFCIAKLSDFGLSVTGQLNGASEVEGRYRAEPIYELGTPGWMAPEFEDGVYPDMLIKTDYFSLGLLLWSVFLKAGKCPIQVADFTASGRACEEASREFETASFFLGAIRSQLFIRLAQMLLPRKPEERTSNLEEICTLLKENNDCSSDISGSWLEGLFEDNTPWDVLGLQNPNAHTLYLKDFEKWKSDTQYITYMIKDIYTTMLKGFETRYAWKNSLCLFPTLSSEAFNAITEHYYSGIKQLACFDGIQLEQLVGPEISMLDLFSFGFDCRLDGLDQSRLSIGLACAVAAARGYLPAQAICVSILSIDEVEELISPSLIAEVEENELEWQQNAVSSGYLLAWNFAANHPTEFQAALDRFRKEGGYNQHYIHLSNDTQPAAHSVIYSCSGMLHYARGSLGGLPWLKDYPLHRAAALGLLREMVELVDVQALDVNALDSQGETPLMKAAMAGSDAAVTFLMNHGADHTIRSPQSGTYPLHYLFLFPPDSLAVMGELLLNGASSPLEGRGLTDHESKKSILEARSYPDLPAFHFPFRWPASTPVGWAVLANNEAAVEVLCTLGSNLNTVDEFFPVPMVIDYNAVAKSSRDSTHVLSKSYKLIPLEPYESWIYSHISGHTSLSVMSCENWFLGMCRLSAKAQKGRRELLNKREIGNPLMKAITSMLRVPDADISAHLETTEESKSWKAFVNKRSWVNGRLPLQMAALNGRSELVSKLLEHGAELNFDTPEQARRDSALWTAVSAGQTSIVKILVEHGARIMSSEILEEACLKAPPETIFLILEATKDAGINVSPAFIAATLRYASVISELDLLEVLAKLFDAGADPNIVDPREGTPLCIAARRGNTNVVRLLLSHGANPNWNGGLHNSNPLQESIEGIHAGHRLESTILLLDAGADPNVISGTTLATPLQAMAYRASGAAGVELLLQRGAQVNLSMPVGKFGSALQAAVVRGDTKTVELLIDSGADVDAPGASKYCCSLKAALELGHTEIVSMLRRGSVHYADDEAVAMCKCMQHREDTREAVGVPMQDDTAEAPTRINEHGHGARREALRIETAAEADHVHLLYWYGRNEKVLRPIISMVILGIILVPPHKKLRKMDEFSVFCYFGSKFLMTFLLMFLWNLVPPGMAHFLKLKRE